MIVITISRDGLDKGVPDPIRLRDVDSGRTVECCEAWPTGRVVVRYMPQAPQADGAVVWVEAEHVSYLVSTDERKWRHL